ncbi:MAG: ABC transporter permease [Azospirillaceae bacterium]
MIASPHGSLPHPPIRPEYEVESPPVGTDGDIARRLTLPERLWANGIVRGAVILIVLAVIWEVYATALANRLMFPRLSSVLTEFWADIANGILLGRAWTTLEVLLMGYAVGIASAAVITTLAVTTQIGRDLLTMLTSMFNPLPAIALLPLALLWFGLGIGSMIFVIVHSVLWSVSLNAFSGFRAVSPTLRMVGQNYGLRGANYVVRILIPAALPSIVSGLKVGWAFAWRTLIAAELVFGVSAGSGGLGWYIYEQKNQLNMSNVFAGLLMVILIGLLMETVVFRALEKRTIARWGMQ